jgi:broad specificity phosphatase PhoE
VNFFPLIARIFADKARKHLRQSAKSAGARLYGQILNKRRGQNSAKLITKKIYLIRHGQTDFNLKNIVQGSGVDTHLNEVGRRQAEAFFNAYKHVPFNKVYTSDLKRSKQSVQHFIDLGIPQVSLVGLNEISWGTKEGHRVTIEEDQYYHFMLSEWQKGRTWMRIEGGESPNDVMKRMKPAVDYIMSKTDETTILICMHGRAMRMLLCHLLNYPLRCMDMFEHQNLCLYLLNYSGSMFSVEKHNDTEHLIGLRN